MHEAFLPAGYPHSVSSDYVSYQIWDSIQACKIRFRSLLTFLAASSLNGVLASRAMLTTIGVGVETATPTAAVMNWVRQFPTVI